jgi:ribosomal protein S28E/S33
MNGEAGSRWTGCSHGGEDVRQRPIGREGRRGYVSEARVEFLEGGGRRWCEGSVQLRDVMSSCQVLDKTSVAR